MIDVRIIFAALAVLVIALVWRAVRKLHRDETAFDMRDLLMENGKVSKAACVMMGAYAVTTWQYIYFSLNEKMTEGYAAIYVAAWITPVVARLISNSEANSGATVTTETKTTLKA